METLYPESITIYDAERAAGVVDPDLDLPYIAETAEAVADKLLNLQTVEAAFGPGDGTMYRLVFVPLAGLVSAPPRVTEHSTWPRHAVSGMKHPGGDDNADGVAFYGQDGYLVVWVEHAAYPVRLGERGNVLTYDYVGEKWNTTDGSGCTLAILLRAIAHYLGRALA